MAERWHPLLNTDEISPGVWKLLDAYDKPYADIALRRVQQGTLLRYRVEFRGEVIGWSSSLKGACIRAHQEFLRSHSPGAAPNAGWPAHPAYRRD